MAARAVILNLTCYYFKFEVTWRLARQF